MVKDLINEAEDSALIALGDMITNLANPGAGAFLGSSDSSSKADSLQNSCDSVSRELYTDLSQVKNKATALKTKSMDEEYIKLYMLDFNEREQTLAVKNSVSGEMKDTFEEKIKDYHTSHKKIMDKVKKYYDESDCPNKILQYHLFVNALISIDNEFKKRENYFQKLKNAFNAIETYYTDTIRSDAWVVKIDRISSINRKQNANVSISISEATMKKGSLEFSQKWKQSSVIRKYQKFVPEITGGFVYTDLDYFTFGTDTSTTGQTVVGEPNRNHIKRAKASLLLNYNLHLKGTTINPLLQIGVGLGADAIPVLMLGAGFRLPKGIVLSGGAALSWTKELKTLKVGDVVGGTSDIEKDLEYQLSPIKWYVGISRRL